MPVAPYPISGVVMDTNSTTRVSGATVIAWDVTQQTSTQTTTNTNGEFVMDLANMSVDYADDDRVQIITFTGTGSNHRSLDHRHLVDTAVGTSDQGNMVLKPTEDHYFNSIGNPMNVVGYIATNTSGTARSIELYDRRNDRLILPIEVPANTTVHLAGNSFGAGYKFDGGVCVILEVETVQNDINAINSVPNLSIRLITGNG